MKKILITGNAGYIGSHLSQILLKNKQYEIHGLDKNLPLLQLHNQYNIDISIDSDWQIDVEYDAVIHLAAEVAVGRSVLNPILYVQTNTVGTLNVLRKIKTKNFIFASTGSAVGMNSPYGISKRLAEEVVHQHCTENNINYTTFRFYNVIGSDGINPTNPDGLMWNLMNAANTGEFVLFGNDYNTIDGSCIRDYTHVNEICYSVIKGIETPSNKIENLGHGIGTSVKQMIEIFKETNSVDFNVKVAPRRAGDLETSVLDNPSSYMEQLYSITELLQIK